MSGRLILVWGGSGSGKSAWAERRLLSLAGRAEQVVEVVCGIAC